MIDLKPCPFCGGKMEVYEADGYYMMAELHDKDCFFA